jgi:hypothetical protein
MTRQEANNHVIELRARPSEQHHTPSVDPTTLDGLPLMLTVAEAAGVLRISRTTAYKLSDEWRASGGRSGLPTVRFGSRLLVRRIDVAEIVGLAPSA